MSSFNKDRQFYLNTINYKNINVKWCQKFYNNFEILESNFMRIPNLMKLNEINIDNNYIVSRFSLSKDNKNVNFAYIYSSYESENNNNEIELIPKFICIGSNFISCDGEYRRRFLNYEIIKKYEEYADILEPIEYHYYNRLKTKYFDLFIETYCNIIEKDNCILSDNSKIMLYNLSEIIYVISYIIEMNLICYSFIDNHTNGDYHKILFDENDKNIFKILYELNQDKIKDIYLFYTKYHEYIDNNLIGNKLMIGQKQIPISMEATNSLDKNIITNYINNIKFKEFREIYFNTIIQELVFNNICGSFPLAGKYFITSNDINLYNNENMIEKVKNMNIIMDILSILPKENTSENIKNLDKILISKEYRNLKSILDEANAIGKTLTPDACLVITGEYIGRTLKDLPKMMESELLRVISGNVLNFPLNIENEIIMDQGDRNFHKLCFEYIYALYCMNLYTGIIHMDLHINNATFFEVNSYYNQYNPEIYIGNGQVIYNVAMFGEQITLLNNNKNNIKDDNEKQYIFPHHGHLAGIIDFSRSFMHQGRLITDSRIDINNRNFVINEQNERVLSVIKLHFPEIAAKIINIVPAFLTSPYDSPEYNYIFKLISTYDIFKLFSEFRDYLKTFSHLIKHSEFLNKIANDSYEYLKLHLNKISLHMDKNYMNEFLNELPFPMQMMNKYFSQYELKNNTEQSVSSELHFELAKERREKVINDNSEKTAINRTFEEFKNKKSGLEDLNNELKSGSDSDFKEIKKSVSENIVEDILEGVVGLSEDTDKFLNLKDGQYPDIKLEEIPKIENSLVDMITSELLTSDEIKNSGTFSYIKKVESNFIKKMKLLAEPKIENETFKKYFKYKLRNPITGNMLGIEHPSNKVCPGFHFNNVFRGNYVVKIVDIYNMVYTNDLKSEVGNIIKDENNFYTPRYSLDGRKKELIPIS